MKRILALACLLLIFAVLLAGPAIAGHAVIGSGQVVECDCGCPPPCQCDAGEMPVANPVNCPKSR